MRRRLGQNFLVDKNIAKKIVEAACVEPCDLIVEIGPGKGVLTERLIRKANRVIAVELDKNLCEFLRTRFEGYCDNLTLVEGDILDFDFHNLKDVKVIGNIPYYITSPLIAHLIEHKRFIDTIFITVQKEFAERLLAKPCSKQYSPISCFVQYHTQPAMLFGISRNAFLPRPEVDSCLVELKVLKPTAKVSVKDERLFFRLIRSAFNKRRKTILNSLASDERFSLNKSRWEVLLKDSGINPVRRPETVSLEEFAKLADVVSKNQER